MGGRNTVAFLKARTISVPTTVAWSQLTDVSPGHLKVELRIANAQDGKGASRSESAGQLTQPRTSFKNSCRLSAARSCDASQNTSSVATW
eukprot:1696463-Rhodomonas_salina.3